MPNATKMSGHCFSHPDTRLLIARLAFIGLALVSLGTSCTTPHVPADNRDSQTVHPDSLTLEGRTRLQSFHSRSGTIVVTGFSTIASLLGSYGTSVVIGAREMFDPTKGVHISGVSIEVINATLGSRATSYIDSDELPALLKAVSYIMAIKSNPTRLANFQVDYRTRSDLALSVFNSSEGDLMCAVNTGPQSATALLPVSDLGRLHDSLVRAQALLDSIATTPGQ